MTKACNGLPGQNVGKKYHYWYMMGYIDGFHNKEHKLPPIYTSQRCKEAYCKGYNDGQEKQVGKNKRCTNIDRKGETK